jgi:hypothetical protein
LLAGLPGRGGLTAPAGERQQRRDDDEQKLGARTHTHTNTDNAIKLLLSLFIIMDDDKKN